MTEDLIGELGRYRNIAVIAKSSSFTYKGKAVDAREVGRELGVRYVLEGGLETDPERVRVAVQLIDARHGSADLVRALRPALRDVFAVRDEMVQQIAGDAPGLWRAGDEPTGSSAPAGSRLQKPRRLRLLSAR